VSHIPAIENFSLSSISSGVGKMVKTGREAAELTKFVAKNYAVPIATSAKEGYDAIKKDEGKVNAQGAVVSKYLEGKIPAESLNESAEQEKRLEAFKRKKMKPKC
jgi:hypothetical protein